MYMYENDDDDEFVFFFSCMYCICIRTFRKTVREEESLSLSRVAAGVPEMEGAARIASS